MKQVDIHKKLPEALWHDALDTIAVTNNYGNGTHFLIEAVKTEMAKAHKELKERRAILNYTPPE